MKKVEVIESVRLGHLLIQDLEKLNYCQLSVLLDNCSKELKKRDRIHAYFTSTTTK